MTEQSGQYIIGPKRKMHKQGRMRGSRIISSVIVILMLAAIGLAIRLPRINGLFAFSDLDLVVEKDSEFRWNLEKHVELEAVKLSGTMIDGGSVKVWLEKNDERYLILDSESLESAREEVVPLDSDGSINEIKVSKPKAFGEDTEIDVMAAFNVVVKEKERPKELVLQEKNFESVCSETCSLTGLRGKSFKLVFDVDNSIVEIDGVEYRFKELEGDNLRMVLIEEVREPVNLDIKVKQNNVVVGDLEEAVEEGTYDLEIVPDKSTIKKIDVNSAVIEKDVSEIMRVDDVLEEYIEEKEFVEVYAIDPTPLEFDSATVTVTAKANALYKCKDWNFTEQKCYGEWKLFKTGLVPGQEYTFTLTPEDPGFGEINIIDAEHLDKKYAFISNVYNETKEQDDNWSEPIYHREYIRATFEQPLSNGNLINVYVRNPAAANNYIEVYEQGGSVVLNSTPIINATGRYDMRISGMSGSNTVFDIRVVNQKNTPTAYLEFDYIVDAEDNVSPSIWGLKINPALSITSFESYNFTVNTTDNGTISFVNLSYKGFNGEGVSCYQYYVNGSCANDEYYIANMTLSIAPEYYKGSIRPDEIYPQIEFADDEVYWYNGRKGLDVYRDEYHIFKFVNNYTINTNTSFWIEFDASPKGITTKGLRVYLFDRTTTITDFQSDWTNSAKGELVAEINKDTPKDHNHTENASHYLVTLTANADGTIGTKSLNVSDLFFIVLYNLENNVNKAWNLSYRDTSLCNTSNWWLGEDSGWTTTQQQGCPDAHIHLARYNISGSSDGITATSCAEDNSSNTNCTTITNYFGAISNLAPVENAILVPQSDTTYACPINLSWNAFSDPNGDTVTYNISLLNPDQSHYLEINDSVLATDYIWNCSSVASGTYSLKVEGRDPAGLRSYSTLDGNFTIDNSAPQWSNNKIYPGSGAQYASGASYQFNVTWTDNYAISDVLIEHNFTGTANNYSMSNLSSEYYYDYTDLAAGSYVWRSYANDSFGQVNYTTQWAYIVNQAAGIVYLYLNGTRADFQTEKGTQVNISAVLINGIGNIQVYNNGTLIYSGAGPSENITLFSVQGLYNITAVYSGNQNYSSDIETWWINVTCTPNILNTSWSAWTNITCLPDDTMNQSRSRTQYDANDCGASNQTFTEYRNTEPCDYCTPNMVNTSWSEWTNLSCSNDQMNQSRFRTQYDANNCGEIGNTTYYEYQLVGPSFINTSWTAWYNITECLPGDYYTQERNRTQYDSYACAANTTFFEQQNQSCDYCTPNMVNTSWSEWTNLSCSNDQMNQSRSRTQYDANNCGEIGNTTYYEYQLVGPSFINTSWTAWYNITECLPGDYYTQERNRTQYDSYACAANTTFFEQQNQSCTFVDSEAPSVIDVTATPGTINQGQSTNLTANVTDVSTIGPVWARVTRADGTISESSMAQSGDIWDYLFTTVLSNPGGVYNVTIRAYDNYSNLNDTETTSFTVNDIRYPSVTNVQPDNVVYDAGSAVEISAEIADETSIDKVIANVSWSSVYEIISLALQPDNVTYSGSFTNTSTITSFTVRILANDTSNNLNGSETSTFNVSDLSSPAYSSIITSESSPVTYSSGASYQFNATWTDNYAMDDVLIEHNFAGSLANYSPSNLSSEYYYDYTDLAAGSYVWRMYANDTYDNKNQTPIQSYVVNKVISACTLAFDPASPEVYGNAINASCSCTNSEASAVLYRNGTDATSENNIYVNLSVGTYLYNCTAVETQNYTSAQDYSTYVITKKTSEINLTLNGKDLNAVINQTQSVDINATLVTPSNGVIQIYQEGVLVNSGASPLYNLTAYSDYGTYNITAVYPESDNYSSGYDTLYVIVQNSIPPAAVTNLGETETGQTRILWTWTEPSDADFDHVEIYLNGVFKKNTTLTYYNATGLSPGTAYTLSTRTADTADNVNTTWVNDTATTDADTQNPQITSYSVTPKAVAIGNDVSITANASDDFSVDDISVNITLPNSTVVTYSVPASYTALISGRHDIIITANDTSGNTATQADYFVAADPINFTVYTVDKDLGSLTANLTIFFPGTTDRINESQVSGDLNYEGADYIYDFSFTAFNGNLSVKLNRVNVSTNDNKTMGFDKLPVPLSGYAVSYGIYSTYTFNYATVSLSYEGANYTDESRLRVFKCDNWDFTNRNCTGTFEQISASQDTSSDTFTASVNSFSGFSIKEVTSASGETPSDGDDELLLRLSRPGCIYDWDCGEWSACIGGTERRVCVNAGTCPDTHKPPETERDCENGYVPEPEPVEEEQEEGNCYDGLQNYDERGVDCGGSCDECLECFDDGDCDFGDECVENYCAGIPALAPKPRLLNLCEGPLLSWLMAAVILWLLYVLVYRAGRFKLKKNYEALFTLIIILLPIIARILLGCVVGAAVLGIEFLIWIYYSHNPVKKHIVKKVKSAGEKRKKKKAAKKARKTAMKKEIHKKVTEHISEKGGSKVEEAKPEHADKFYGDMKKLERHGFRVKKEKYVESEHYHKAAEEKPAHKKVSHGVRKIGAHVARKVSKKYRAKEEEEIKKKLKWMVPEEEKAETKEESKAEEKKEEKQPEPKEEKPSKDTEKGLDKTESSQKKEEKKEEVKEENKEKKTEKEEVLEKYATEDPEEVKVAVPKEAVEESKEEKAEEEKQEQTKHAKENKDKVVHSLKDIYNNCSGDIVVGKISKKKKKTKFEKFKSGKTRVMKTREDMLKGLKQAYGAESLDREEEITPDKPAVQAGKNRDELISEIKGLFSRK